MSNLIGMQGPFWQYFGGKWRAALRYPKPQHRHIIEPFAGSAGYSMRYPSYDITLVERNPTIAEMWRYLVAVPSDELLRVPSVEHVDDLPDWVPAGARALVGFWMNAAATSPRRRLSAGNKRRRASGKKLCWWGPETKQRIAQQVQLIRHWRVLEMDYANVPDALATWFVDPPYISAGTSYPYGSTGIDYPALGLWCRSRKGQVIVCENMGAAWLPFRPFCTLKGSFGRDGSREAIWTNDCDGA